MPTVSPVSDPDLGGAARRLASTAGGGDPRDDLLRQSQVARELGSPFVSDVLAAARRQLARAPRLDARIAGWPFDPARSAMALRLNAGLHALARRGTIADLSTLYAGRHRNFDRAVGEAIELGEQTLLVWMDHPTQTNEVRRSSAFMAALSVLADQHGLPFELFEVGASAGLNLLLDRYAHDLGGVACGQPDSGLRLTPSWQGPPPPRADVRIASAHGVDLRPLRLEDPHTCERLMSYVWPGDEVRADYLRRAMRLARAAPPAVDRQGAETWLAERLEEPQAPGTMRVVQHSMVLQYLPDAERRTVLGSLLKAGRNATPDRPMARIGLEWNRDRSEVQLCMTQWSGRPGDGRRTILAICHPYGAAIEWRGLPRLPASVQA
ncbi:DUF2332 domain-containing protein [Novosphingobium mangrovi (ex Huang et al. 2023)]|uniref:DUF2332 family protein n=1 Tax=Novosphingobium mangrovi (ex Huang et al. 2023) TaxID=2976432 RepID=A0ABT2I976_9SPHN|nr:DUF2332 family protein [Novosphingobium mangrovi (ex Huang et al. 2023)]MCT2401362.1 DUF2332 family protein [Novosphingobium mangrovi (ex Huang et al. 2023)]